MSPNVYEATHYASDKAKKDYLLPRSQSVDWGKLNDKQRESLSNLAEGKCGADAETLDDDGLEGYGSEVIMLKKAQ